MKKLLIMAMFLTGCAKDAPKNVPTENPDPVAYSYVSARALAMSDNGWIVSRWPDGAMRDQGDSLLFTGLAMGSLNCADGSIPERALLKMLQENHGKVYRHPSIPDDYSLDGLLGLWWGISHRVKKCPESQDAWTEILPEHAAAVTIEPYFEVVLKTVMGEPVSDEDRGRLGAEIASWAFGVVTHRAAAYRLHLGFLALDLVDAPKGKAAFCGTVGEAHMPLLDDFCGKEGLADWMGAFDYDRYVYAHQRAVWEAPDGRPGLSTPGIDYLIAYSRLQ